MLLKHIAKLYYFKLSNLKIPSKVRTERKIIYSLNNHWLTDHRTEKHTILDYKVATLLSKSKTLNFYHYKNRRLNYVQHLERENFFFKTRLYHWKKEKIFNKDNYVQKKQRAKKSYNSLPCKVRAFKIRLN